MSGVIPFVEAAPNVNPGDVSGRVLRLSQLLEKLGITGFLDRPQELLQQATAWNVTTAEEKRQATLRWAEHRERALRGEIQAAELPRLTARVWSEVALWLDTGPEGTDAAPAMGAMVDLQRDSRSRAAPALDGQALSIYTRLQEVAQRAVARTVALPALPEEVWTARDQASTRSIQLGHELTWVQLVARASEMTDAHEAARILRGGGGLPPMAFPGGCPGRLGVEFLNWEPALGEGEERLKKLPGPLRVRAAADWGWRPGLWLPADHEREAAAAPAPSLASRARGWLFPNPTTGEKPVEVL